MWRSVLAAVVLFLCVYIYGHPVFDGYRPARFDRPLQSLYADVNLVARMGIDTIHHVDGERAKQQVKNFAQKVQGEISNQLP
jgi:hypothetical protein